MGIAKAAVAATGNQDTLAWLRQIRNQRLLVFRENLRPGGTLRTQSAPLAPERFLPMPGWPFFALKCCW